MSRIGIVDCGMGNLFSVFNALEHLGAEASICSLPDELTDVEKIVFPGVGSFVNCMRRLQELKFTSVLQELVLEKKVPILGICLGMQVMARIGYEGGKTTGLGWFDAEVIKISNPDVRVPHVGWDEIKVIHENELLNDSFSNKDFYFVHSYAMQNFEKEDVSAVCLYGDEFTVAVSRENIFGVQFHPEKSQDVGLELLDRFVWEI